MFFSRAARQASLEQARQHQQQPPASVGGGGGDTKRRLIGADSLRRRSPPDLEPAPTERVGPEVRRQIGVIKSSKNNYELHYERLETSGHRLVNASPKPDWRDERRREADLGPSERRLPAEVGKMQQPRQVHNDDRDADQGPHLSKLAKADKDELEPNQKRTCGEPVGGLEPSQDLAATPSASGRFKARDLSYVDDGIR